MSVIKCFIIKQKNFVVQIISKLIILYIYIEMLTEICGTLNVLYFKNKSGSLYWQYNGIFISSEN